MLKLAILSALFASVSTFTIAANEKKEAPDYLKEARLAMFMANEVVKYCEELNVDEDSFKSWYAQLQKRLATDGIKNIKEDVKPASWADIFAGAQQIMEENGGPFAFSPEKYCRYGRRQMQMGSDIGILLKDTK